MADHAKAGANIKDIAKTALSLPLFNADQKINVDRVVHTVADYFGINIWSFKVAGSARFGFSLNTGECFDPRFSDLDIALISSELFAKCCSTDLYPLGDVRFPDSQLPLPQRAKYRKFISELSRSHERNFSQISIAVHRDLASVVCTTASAIERFFRPNSLSPQIADRLNQDRVIALDAQPGHGFFPNNIADATPFNSAPFVVDWDHIQNHYLANSRRRDIYDSLGLFIQLVEEVAELSCCLIGGSFIDPEVEHPADIDVVIFYTARSGLDRDLGRMLKKITNRALMRDIDVRFVPCDTAPWITIKIAAFFTTLYQASRDGRPRPGPLLTIDQSI
ncbi:DUF6932 family protein [Xanthomonas bromi]|nr:hypothetical protein [Xanthomonas bromi]